VLTKVKASSIHCQTVGWRGAQSPTNRSWFAESIYGSRTEAHTKLTFKIGSIFAIGSIVKCWWNVVFSKVLYA